MHKELTNRKIRYTKKKDVLRWGYTPRGIFTTKEAYTLMLQTWNQLTPPGHAYGPPKYGPKFLHSPGCFIIK